MPRLRLSCFTLILAFVASCTCLHSAEETGFSWPLGPIGGKFRIWTDKSFIRVSEVTAAAPGQVAGLQVGDFITGAFGRGFDPISGSKFDGPVRQLGAAIDYAETNNLALPLSILRPGVGNLTLTVNLPATSGLGPAYTLTSSRYAAIYETACAALHARIMATSNGDIGYPTGFAGLGLLGHPNWNDTAGTKPYRLSINKIRDYFITRINGAVYAPVEDLLLDSVTAPSANPNYVDNPVGLESWTLGQAVMFLAEYQAKTGDTSYAAALQLGAELMANRVESGPVQQRMATAGVELCAWHDEPWRRHGRLHPPGLGRRHQHDGCASFRRSGAGKAGGCGHERATERRALFWFRTESGRCYSGVDRGRDDHPATRSQEHRTAAHRRRRAPVTT